MNSLDYYDERPSEMNRYLSHYGWHFNKRMAEFAIRHLKGTHYNREKVDELLKTYNIEIPDSCLYDYVYILNYAVSKYYESSLTTEKQLALFVKDNIDEDGLIFTKWYATMLRLGHPINWEDML